MLSSPSTSHPKGVPHATMMAEHALWATERQGCLPTSVLGHFTGWPATRWLVVFKTHYAQIHTTGFLFFFFSFARKHGGNTLNNHHWSLTRMTLCSFGKFAFNSRKCLKAVAKGGWARKERKESGTWKKQIVKHATDHPGLRCGSHWQTQFR